MTPESITEAWGEFKRAVAFEAFCLHLAPKDDGPGFPTPLAWLCAPWRPLLYRFSRYEREKLFQPNKADRRQRLTDLTEYVFWCGVGEMTDEKWAEADALAVEFGRDFPPRDWEPMSVAEAVGAGMGMSREAVAEILAEP